MRRCHGLAVSAYADKKSSAYSEVAFSLCRDAKNKLCDGKIQKWPYTYATNVVALGPACTLELPTPPHHAITDLEIQLGHRVAANINGPAETISASGPTNSMANPGVKILMYVSKGS